MYDFHKTVQDPNNGEFHHMYFRKDRPELMSLIKRKANSRTESSKKNRNASAINISSSTPSSSMKIEGEMDSAGEEPVTEEIVSFPLEQSEPLRSEEHDLERRVMELEYASNRLSEIENQYARVIGENQMLKRMIIDSRNKQDMMQDKMNYMVKILYKLYITVNPEEIGISNPSLLEKDEFNRYGNLNDEKNLLENIVPALTALKTATADLTDTSVRAAFATMAGHIQEQSGTNSQGILSAAQSVETSSSPTSSGARSKQKGNTKVRDRPPLRRPSLNHSDNIVNGNDCVDGALAVAGPAREKSSVVEKCDDTFQLSRQSSFDMAASSVYFSGASPPLPLNETSAAINGNGVNVGGSGRSDSLAMNSDSLGAPLVRLNTSMDSFLSYLGRTETPLLNADTSPLYPNNSSLLEEGIAVKLENESKKPRGGGELVRQRAFDLYSDPMSPMDVSDQQAEEIGRRRSSKSDKIGTDEKDSKQRSAKGKRVSGIRSRGAELGEKRKQRRGNDSHSTVVTTSDIEADETSDETPVEPIVKTEGFKDEDRHNDMDSEPTFIEGLPRPITETSAGAFTRLDSLESTLSSLLDLCSDEPQFFSPSPSSTAAGTLTSSTPTLASTAAERLVPSLDEERTTHRNPSLERLSSGLERLSSVLAADSKWSATEPSPPKMTRMLTRASSASIEKLED
eukprot:CAMPEP_0182435724 /NCGR_PEP_ID=MMETSP1167-20130531/77274_1 /TAXON_ID=2988 /ORGANISM="Mallomonas Sp, Strain CCMP3275" /LENGTH=682 /DNA_ID=CAMNT_0024627079 /DNA_START=369 /DNA_END=2417 /DNA_ORIENTATION=-